MTGDEAMSEVLYNYFDSVFTHEGDTDQFQKKTTWKAIHGCRTSRLQRRKCERRLRSCEPVRLHDLTK